MDRKHIISTALITLTALGVIAGALLLFRQCGTETDQPLPQKDPDAEYQAMLNACFNSPDDGQEAAAAYMGYFTAAEYEDRATVAEEILNAFLQMDDFFSKSFTTYRSFLSQTGYMDSRFEKSPYPVVRDSWKEISALEKQQHADDALASVDTSDFKEWLSLDAEQLCCEECEGYWIGSWSIAKPTTVTTIDTPVTIPGQMAKKCSGSFHVYLEGITGLGIRKGEADIEVEGKISFDERGDMTYSRIRHEYLSSSGDVKTP